ncbi:MAG: hypothetical protein PHV23_01415 [Candidatus Gracilibacteria bacterium]|nr:hypothetical protein [Candidatus Gracilibacteria bacterium]
MKKIFLILVFLLSFSITSFADNNEIKEIKTYDNYSNIGNIVSSFDGNSMSFSAKKKGGFIIVKDGKEIGNEYYEILDYSYSDNSIYYIANKSYKGEYILLKDGKEILSINGNPKELYTSKIGGKYAINLGYKFIINGEETKKYDKILYFSFSYDGNDYTYQFLNGDGGYKINKNGVELNNYKYMYSPIFSSDGKEFSYIAEKENGNFVVVKNGGELNSEFQSIGYIAYLSKGNNIFYTAENNDEKGLYINNKLLAKLTNSIDVSSISFNSTINGESYVFSYKDRIKLINIFNINGKEFESHSLSDISDSSFSLINSDYAITLNNNTSYANIIKNGEKLIGYDKTYSPLFLDNGTFAFIGEKNNKRFLVIDGKEKEIENSGISSGIYSLDGKNIIYWIGDGSGKNKKIEIFYLDSKKFLSFTKDIADPKTVSKDPQVIGVNGILAFLYIILFYFTGALFNSYFQDDKWSISNLNKKLNFYWSYVWYKFYSFTKNILKIVIKNSKIILYVEKIEKLIGKYSHKINIILGFIALGIISQIIVGELDLNSINGYLLLLVIILIVGVLSLLKDLILYLLIKKSEKEGIKIELIPSGFIFLSIVALFVNISKIVPGTLFGATHKLNTLSSVVKRKILNPKKLLFILFFVYLIGIGFWFSSSLFQENSIYYKLVLTNYFSISSDIFFNLLPFGLFWGVYIFKDQKVKKYWLLFLFISFFTLLHTIFNKQGDFSKVLKLQENNLNIFIIILIFWGFLTLLFWYFNFYRLNKKL